MGTAFLRILDMSITASFLMAFVILLRFFIRKKIPKWSFCVLWAFVAVRLVCPIAVESPLSLVPDRATITEQRSPIRDRPQPEQGSPQSTGDTNVQSGDNEGLKSEAVSSSNAGDGKIVWKIRISPADAFGGIWACGLTALLFYGVLSYIKLRRRTAVSVKVEDPVWQCDEIRTPFILGMIRPRIYVPSDLDAAQSEYVIAHEKVHLKRHDHWWKPLGFIVLSVHWFNPLCWISYILFCRDIELACDERVVREKSEQYKKSYAEALLACSVGKETVSMCPLAFGETGVKERIKNVMNYKKPTFWVMLTAAAACLIVAVCFLTNPQKKENTNIRVTGEDAQQGDAKEPESLNGAGESADAGNSPDENGGNGRTDSMRSDVGARDDIPVTTDDEQENRTQKEVPFDVPVIVWEQAQQYVQAAFDRTLEGAGQLGGAFYSEWRIQNLEYSYTYPDLAGMPREIYCLNYEFLAKSPEQVVLTGGMEISEDGWVVPESPNSNYLVFTKAGDSLVYFCGMSENDCAPGDDLFTSDLVNYCMEIGLYDESEGFNPNGEELIRRFKEVDIETLHAAEYTQDIADKTGILCLGELPEHGIRLYGYNDENYWRQGVAVEIDNEIFYFDWGYMTPRIKFPALYWNEEKGQLQITLPIYTGTSFSAQKLVVLQYDKNGGLQPNYFKLDEFTQMINERLDFHYDEGSGTLTLSDKRTGEEAGTAQLPGEAVYGIWAGDISEFVLGDTIRFRVTPGYLTDAVAPQYENMPALEFEVEILESDNGLAFSFGELCR